MASIASESQAQLLLTKQLLSVPKGHPRKVIRSSINTPDLVFEFDKNGRLILMEQGDEKARFNWTSDSTEVEWVLFAEQTETARNIVSIDKLTETECEYECDGVIFDFKLRKDGAVLSYSISSSESKMEITHHFRNDNDIYPFQIVQSDGVQAGVVLVNINETDQYGNATSVTQSINGQQMTFLTTIEYY